MDNNIAIGRAITAMDADPAVKAALKTLFSQEVSQGKLAKAAYLKAISDGAESWDEKPEVEN